MDGSRRRRRQASTHQSPDSDVGSKKSRRGKGSSKIRVVPSPVRSSARALSPVHSCELTQEEGRETKFRDTRHAESTVLASRPTPEECLLAVQGLGQIHPEVLQDNNERRLAFAARNRKADDKSTPITDAIVNTMLSQNTTAANQRRAYANLKRDFPDWEQVAESSNASRVAAAIRCAGLSEIRTERMQLMLQKVKEQRGKANFEHLADCSSDEIKKELLQHKGMGPKTVSCVLLFALLKPEFPVDTHVLRISKQNRWVPASFSRESAYSYLNDVIPDDLKLDLHCLLVTHGKHCNQCAARGKAQFPRDFDCPLAAMRRGRKLEGIKQEQEVKVKNEPSDGDTVKLEQVM